MKNIFIVITAIVIFVILSSPSFWNWIYQNGRIEKKGFSQLKFSSIAGDYEIFIDDKLLGDVRDKEEKLFVRIEQGERVLKIVRKSDIKNFYYTLIRQINFMPSAQVELKWEAGPTLESSNGILKYFVNVVNPNGAELLIEPFPADSIIKINTEKIDKKLIEVRDTNQMIINVSHGEKFIPQEFVILLRDENTNTVPKNVRLIVEVYLYKKPF